MAPRRAGARVVRLSPDHEPEGLHLDDFSFLDLLWSILIIYAPFGYIMILSRSWATFFETSPPPAAEGRRTLFIALPLLGALIYLIARGRETTERAVESQKASQSQFDEYVRDVAGAKGDPAAQIAKAK